MQLGMKVDPVRMTGPHWGRTFGSPETFFGYLKERGIDFVEYPLGEQSDLYLFSLVGETAAEAGLSCSFHPYLHQNLAPEIFDEKQCSAGMEQILQSARRLANLSNDHTSIVFHGGLAGYEPHYRSREQASEAARSFFAWLGKRFSDDIRLFAETQLPHDATDQGLIRLGDTFDGVMELIEGTEIGVCWDVGHSWRSTELKKQPALPSETFLRRVGHVHLHDASWDDRGNFNDHQPLGEGSCPWRRYLSLLFKHGFDGRILLELVIDPRYVDYNRIDKWIEDFRKGVGEAKS